MVRCGACGATSAAGKRFCIDCGAALHAACPVCGEPVEQGQRFCGECGAPLIETASGGLGSRAAGTRLDTGRDASAPLAVTEGPGPELRHVSVLFCDLVGFTPLAERRDPEEVRELLSGYFELARAIVTRYGGVVEKFIGDAVMALWGAPVAKEDDAERAVRAGLELVSAVPAYGASRGAELSARVGVATGERGDDRDRGGRSRGRRPRQHRGPHPDGRTTWDAVTSTATKHATVSERDRVSTTPGSTS